jgi:hypothetical protein
MPAGAASALLARMYLRVARMLPRCILRPIFTTPVPALVNFACHALVVVAARTQNAWDAAACPFWQLGTKRL